MIALPIIVVGALEMMGVAVPTFLSKLQNGSIWQEQALRSLEATISIEAHLGRDGLRCAVRLTDASWYHYPADQLHLFNVVLPATVMALTNLAAALVVGHDLLRDPRIIVRTISPLNDRVPDMGSLIRFTTPLRSYPISARQTSGENRIH